jgi:hypothetical protein
MLSLLIRPLHPNMCVYALALNTNTWMKQNLSDCVDNRCLFLFPASPDQHPTHSGLGRGKDVIVQSGRTMPETDRMR